MQERGTPPALRDMRMPSLLPAICFLIPLALIGCDRPAERPERAPSASGRQALAVRCYRSEASVLLGPIVARGQQGKGPGWIRVDGLGADSGRAALRDADTKTMLASWKRATGDSIDVTAFDDFLRVELRIVASDTLASGVAAAHSDAALERDSAGAMQDLRRNWVLSAPVVSCDSMPSDSVTGEVSLNAASR